MIMTVSGVGWVILDRAPATSGTASGAKLRTGLLLAFAAAISQSLGFVFSKQGIGQYDAVSATFIRVLVAIVSFAVLVTASRRWSHVVTAMRDRTAMRIAVFGSFVGPFLGVALSLVALRHCHAGVAATIISTTPILILPFVIVLHHEHVSLRAALGAVISVAGVALLVL